MTKLERLTELFEEWTTANRCAECCDTDCTYCYTDSEAGLFKYFIDNGVSVPLHEEQEVSAS